MEGGVRSLTMLNPNPALGWQAGVDLSSLSVHGHAQPLRASQRRPAHPHASARTPAGSSSRRSGGRTRVGTGRRLSGKASGTKHSSAFGGPINRKRGVDPEEAWRLVVLAHGESLRQDWRERRSTRAEGERERERVCLPLQSMNGAVLLLSW